MIRFTSKRNPLGLELGERVSYTHTSSIEYRDTRSGRKTLEFLPLPGSGKVVGIKYRCEGVAMEESEAPLDLFGPPVRYTVWKTVKRHLLYEVRAGLHSKPVLVHPDHIQITEDKHA